MRVLNSCLLALVIVSGTLALSPLTVDYDYKVKERIAPPRGWQKISSAPADHIIHLRIGLPQSHFDELERHLYEVSDPFHSRYGQHLSKTEVEELVAPPRASLNLVNEWLGAFGLKEEDFVRSSAKDWVTVKVPINVAEQMLNTVRQSPLPCSNHDVNILTRNTTSGSTEILTTTSSEQLPTAFQTTCTNTLNSFSRLLCLLAGKR